MGAAWAFNPNEPPVRMESAAIRAVYAEPIPDDYFRLWVARTKLRVAGDHKGAEALERYFTGVALGMVNGKPVVRQGTIGDIIGHVVNIDGVDEALKELLATTLRGEIVTIPGNRSFLPAEHPTDFTRYREEVPGVWVEFNRERPAYAEQLHIPVAVRNVTARPVSQADKQIVLARADGPMKFSCRERNWALNPIPPGEAVVHDCYYHTGQAMPVSEVVAAVRDPSRWSLEVSRITYVDPPFGFTRGRNAYGVGDANSPRSEAAAAGKAYDELKALNCWQRNACDEDFKRGPGPAVVAFLFVVAIGAAVGTALALGTRRRWMWGGISIAGYVVFSVAAILYFGLMGGNYVLVALLVAAAALVGLVAFVIGLVTALATVRRRPPEA